MNIEFDLLDHGYTLCSPAWQLVYHRPTFNRIYYIESGEAYYSYNNITYRMEPHCLYIFPAMHHYSMHHNADNPLKMLWFHITIKNTFLTDFSHYYIKDDSILMQYINILKTLSNDKLYHSEFKDTLAPFLSLTNKYFNILHDEDPFLSRASCFIEKSMQRGISVEKLADHFNMERSYFSRYFKSRFNISPIDYIFSKKINTAALLLSHGQSTSKVCFLCGYKDEKAFIRAFKFKMGISPAVYRNTLHTP